MVRVSGSWQCRPMSVPADQFLKVASQKAGDSLQVARELLEAGYPSPAFVWAVRAVEVFYKEFLLAPHFYEGDWGRGRSESEQALRIKQLG